MLRFGRTQQWDPRQNPAARGGGVVLQWPVLPVCGTFPPPRAWQGRRGQLRGHPGASLGPGLSPGAVTPSYFQQAPSPAPRTLSFTPQLQVHQGAPARAPTPAPPSRFLFLLSRPKATSYHLHTRTTTCQPRCLSQTSPQGVCSPQTPRGALCPAGGGDVPARVLGAPHGAGPLLPVPPPKNRGEEMAA